MPPKSGYVVSMLEMHFLGRLVPLSCHLANSAQPDTMKSNYCTIEIESYRGKLNLIETVTMGIINLSTLMRY